MDNLILTTGNAMPDAGNELLRREFRAMGSNMMALLQSNAPFAGEALARVPNWFEGWEQQLSRFRPDSELSRLNNITKHPVGVSPELLEVLQLALAAADDTDGLVTPAVLGAMEAAGYDRSFEAFRSSEVVTGDTETGTGRIPDWREIEVDAGGCTVRLPHNVRLDFGGIAKGWAADRAAAWLGHTGPALVDAGGDIAVSGPMLDGSPWPIGVADPRSEDANSSENIAILGLYSGGVATSGRDYRRWVRNGRAAHHIIDPRTGEPAETDVLSTTVVAPSAAAADIAAKTVLILGSQAGLRWLDSKSALAGLLVLEDGAVVQSRTFSEYTWK